MRIHIYYGGRGFVTDPTLWVIEKFTEVLEELRVQVERYNLYEHKNLSTLPSTLKDADGIVLATTVEWYGIGGAMQQFLDACWLYGDREKIPSIYMCPIVMSTTYGEREAELNLITAWEILGGRPCSGLCGYIGENVALELHETYHSIVERKAENLYRTVNQKQASFPASNQAVKQQISTTPRMDLSPQETEELSRFVANEEYVQQQKEDILELSNMFRDRLKEDKGADEEYLSAFRRRFVPQRGFQASYTLVVDGWTRVLRLGIREQDLDCYYEDNKAGSAPADGTISLPKSTLEDITKGRMTFQRAFMSGNMRMKGEFRLLRLLDELFPFAAQV